MLFPNLASGQVSARTAHLQSIRHQLARLEGCWLKTPGSWGLTCEVLLVVCRGLGQGHDWSTHVVLSMLPKNGSKHPQKGRARDKETENQRQRDRDGEPEIESQKWKARDREKETESQRQKGRDRETETESEAETV